MSLSEKLAQLLSIKNDIKEAITAMGGEATDDMTQYAYNILNIPTGGGGDFLGEFVAKTMSEFRTSYNLPLSSMFGDKSYLFASMPDLELVSLPRLSIFYTGTLSSQETHYYSIFANNPKLKTINLLQFEGTFPMYGLQNCSMLEEVVMPKCLSIARNAFENCTSLSTITLDACEYISSSAFLNCNNLETANFPECSFIAASAFKSCSKLASISFPKCESVADYAFQSTPISEINFPMCRSIATSAFFNCSNLTTAILPACSHIGNSAFASCSNLTSITLYGSTYIAGYAFMNCSKLSYVNLELFGPKSIGQSAFTNCINLLSDCFTFNSSVSYYAIDWRYVSYRPFSNTPKLKFTISLPNLYCFTNTSYTYTIKYFPRSMIEEINCPNLMVRDGFIEMDYTHSEDFHQDDPRYIYLSNAGDSKYFATINWNTNILRSYYNEPYYLSDVTILGGYLTNYSNRSIIDTTSTIKVLDCIDSAPYLETLSLPACVYIGQYNQATSGMLRNLYIPNIKYISAGASFSNIFYEARLSNGNLWTGSANGNSKFFALGVQNSASTYLDFSDVKFITGSFSSLGTNQSLINCESVEFICDFAFQNASRLAGAVSFPNAKYIGTQAFSNCSNITSIYAPNFPDDTGYYTFPNDINSPMFSKNFESYMFYNCQKLSSININFNAITTLGSGCFYNCWSLTELSFPNCIEISGASVFYNCSNLSLVYMPNLQRINGSYIFSPTSTTKLRLDFPELISAIYMTGTGTSNEFIPLSIFGTMQYYEYINLPKMSGTITCGNNANSCLFSGSYCKTKYLSIPNITGVTPGHGNLFSVWSTSTFEFVNINGFTVMPSIWRLSSLQSLYAENCQRIPSGALAWLNSLSDLYIPNCTDIGSMNFAGFTNMSILNLPNVETLGGMSSQNTIRTISAPNLKTISGIFNYCSYLEYLDFPKLELISTSGQGYTFSSCANLSYLSFPKLKIIDTSTFFSKCPKLSNIDFPELETITGSAFNYASELNSISFPNLKSIPSYCFYSCTGLTELSFPNVSIIGGSAFYYCRNLSKLYLGYSSVVEPSSNMFYNTSLSNSTGRIYVPTSLYSDYLAHSWWRTYSSNLEPYNFE